MREVLTVKKDELLDLCKDLSPKADIQVSDRSYAILEKGWVHGPAYDAYKKWLQFHGVSYWRTNWDCDDISISFKQFLQILHSKQNPHDLSKLLLDKTKENTTNAESVAVGVINYNTGGSYHAINILLSVDGYGFSPEGSFHTYKFSFFEPDGGAEAKLKEKEKDSICFINF